MAEVQLRPLVQMQVMVADVEQQLLAVKVVKALITHPQIIYRNKE